MSLAPVISVSKPTAYTFDLGFLLANDPNPLTIDPSDLEKSLASMARDGTQALINQLLLTCPITADKEGVTMQLPEVTTPLPREKPVPTPKPETKWRAFARRKGIKPKTREQRRNIQYNETTGAWERRWGYKGANKAEQHEPIIEVSAKKEAKRPEETSVRGDKRREIRERVKRNEKRMRRNERRAI